MFIDLTYPLEKDFLERHLKISPDGKGADKFGHFGTHLDVMDKEFPFAGFKRKGKIFDISSIQKPEIEPADVDFSQIAENDFVLFHTGILRQSGYGTAEYLKTYKELSNHLISRLISKKISLLGIDMAGVRKQSEHAQADQYLADNGIFVIENLINLDILFEEAKNKSITIHTYPMLITGSSGLPVRILAEIEEFESC